MGATGLADELLLLISQFETCAQSLFAAVPTTSLPTSQINALHQANLNLASVANQIPRHQQNQQRIIKYLQRIRDFDSNWKKEISQAVNLSSELESLLDQAKRDADVIQQSNTNKATPDQILQLARQLAPFTSAPPVSADEPKQWPPDLRAMMARGAFPPYPTEDVMRRGILGLMDMEHTNEDQEDGEDVQKVFSNNHHDSHIVHQAHSQRRPREDKVDDFAFDLDLNPDMDL